MFNEMMLIRLVGFHFGVSSHSDWYCMKPLLLFLYSTAGATSVSPRMRGLLWMGATSVDAALTCSALTANCASPCQPTLQPAGSNLRLQHLSRIHASGRPWGASRSVGEGHVRGMDLLIIVLLICFAANFLPLCSIQWDSGLSNKVWKTYLKTAGIPL